MDIEIKKFILKKLEETSISLYVQDGKSPLKESVQTCSRGSVPIITNKGGLPETTKYPNLNKLSEKALTKNIEKLIKNKKLLKIFKLKITKF